MVVTVAYALLFGALRLMKLPPAAIATAAGFVTSVAVGQALLFGGNRPRLSSLLVGVVYITGFYVYEAVTGSGSGAFDLRWEVIVLWSTVAAMGAFLGYIAGTAVGAIFLVSDVMRKAIRWSRRR